MIITTQCGTLHFNVCHDLRWFVMSIGRILNEAPKRISPSRLWLRSLTWLWYRVRPITVDFTTHGWSHIYDLSCPSVDSLDPMDQYCTFDVSKIIPKNTYYLMYVTFNPFLAYIRGYYTWILPLNPVNWNISPPADSKVFHWSEWFRSRTNRSQRLITPP